MDKIKGNVICRIRSRCIDDYVIQSWNEALFTYIRYISYDKINPPITGVGSPVPKYPEITVSDKPNDISSLLDFDVWVDHIDCEYNVHAIIQKAMKKFYTETASGLNERRDPNPPFTRHLDVISSIDGFDYYIIWEV